MAKKETSFFADVQTRQQDSMAKIETEQHDTDEIVAFSLRMPAELRRRLRYHYAQTGESMNSFIVRVIKNELGL